MTDPAAESRRTTVILSLFWGSILLSLTLPWGLLTLFEISAHRRTILEAIRYVRLHLFAPGYEYFLVGVLSALPFVGSAVFLLLHLGWHRLEPGRYARRKAGVVGSLLLMFGITFWTHLSALMYPTSRGALVYFYLPYILLVLIPLGYGMGRLVWTITHLLRREETDLP